MTYDPGLDGYRERTNWRRFLRERGPDTGREVDHLKARAADAGAMLELYESGLVPADSVQTLTSSGGEALFMLDASDLGGSDVLG